MQEQIDLILTTGQTIPTRLKRSSRAKRLIFKVEDDSTFSLIIPKTFTLRKIQKELPHFLPKIEKFLATLTAKPPLALPQTIAVQGLQKEFKISVTNEWKEAKVLLKAPQKACLYQHDSCLLLYDPDNNLQNGIRLLQIFFWRLGKLELTQLFMAKAVALGYTDLKVSIRNQKSKMGSCSQRQDKLPAISLNWRASFLSPALLDHLFCHELAHLKQMNHSEAFYAALEKISSNCKLKEKELNIAWANLPACVLQYNKLSS